MMKNKQAARKYKSSIVKKMLAESTTSQKLKVATKMKIAARLEDILMEKGWTNSFFAEKVQKNPSEITKWLSGTHNFTTDTLSEIACVLEISVGGLFERMPVQVVNKINIVVTRAIESSPIRILTPYQELWSKEAESKTGSSWVSTKLSNLKMEVC
jgi:transcriptional regulator with XRE-family HTH domain